MKNLHSKLRYKNHGSLGYVDPKLSELLHKMPDKIQEENGRKTDKIPQGCVSQNLSTKIHLQQ